MKNKITCSRVSCKFQSSCENTCNLKIVAIDDNGECVSYAPYAPYIEPPPNEMDEHTNMC